MDVTPEVYRDLMGRLAGGVAIVTARGPEGEPLGLTATAVCAVSLEPPLVLACVGRNSQTGGAIRGSRRYALNFLASDSRPLADRFASAGAGKYEGVDWEEGAHGCAVLKGSLAYVECEMFEEFEAGDHTIFVGRVLAGSRGASVGGPLIHFRGRYHALPDEPQP